MAIDLGEFYVDKIVTHPGEIEPKRMDVESPIDTSHKMDLGSIGLW